MLLSWADHRSQVFSAAVAEAMVVVLLGMDCCMPFLLCLVLTPCSGSSDWLLLFCSASSNANKPFVYCYARNEFLAFGHMSLAHFLRNKDVFPRTIARVLTNVIWNWVHAVHSCQLQSVKSKFYLRPKNCSCAHLFMLWLTAGLSSIRQLKRNSWQTLQSPPVQSTWVPLTHVSQGRQK